MSRVPCSMLYLRGPQRRKIDSLFISTLKRNKMHPFHTCISIDRTLDMYGVSCPLHVVTPPMCDSWFSSRSIILELASHEAIVLTTDASNVLRWTRKRKTVWRKMKRAVWINMAHGIVTPDASWWWWWWWWWWWGWWCREMMTKTTRSLPCNTLHLYKEVPLRGLQLCKERSMWSKQSNTILIKGSMSTWKGSLQPSKFSGWRRQGARWLQRTVLPPKISLIASTSTADSSLFAVSASTMSRAWACAAKTNTLSQCCVFLLTWTLTAYRHVTCFNAEYLGSDMGTSYRWVPSPNRPTVGNSNWRQDSFAKIQWSRKKGSARSPRWTWRLLSQAVTSC